MGAEAIREARVAWRSDDDAVAAAPPLTLTPRQTELIEDAMRGLTAKESAKLHQLKLSTVKNHRLTLIRRLGAKNMPHAVAIYLGALD